MEDSSVVFIWVLENGVELVKEKWDVRRRNSFDVKVNG